MLQKGSKFRWGEDCDRAFNKLKTFLASAPVLHNPDFNKPFSIACDASNLAVAGVLQQMGHPIAYFSKKLNKSQINYSTIEKETLAIVLTLEHFDVYLSGGGKIIVYSDLNPLTFLKTMCNSNQRLTRWFLGLQRYNIEVRHIAGKDDVLADALSRNV